MLSASARRTGMSYNIAGIDVHKKMLAVVVADIEVEGEYQFERLRFGANPEQLQALCTWLTEHRLENHLLMLDFPKARLGSLGFGVCGSFAKCALASTFRLPLDPVPHNVLPCVEQSRSAGKADGRSLRWLDYVPCARPGGDTRSEKCFLWSWLQRWQLD